MRDQKHLLDCLTTVPATDCNFTGALADAVLETLTDALDARARAGGKTAFRAIRAEMHRRYKESGADLREADFDEYVAGLKEREAAAGAEHARWDKATPQRRSAMLQQGYQPRDGNRSLFREGNTPSPMPKAILKPAARHAGAVIDLPPDPSQAWSKARRYVEFTSLHLAASCAAQVLAGMELLTLHKLYNVRKGQRNDLKSNFSHDVRSWEEAVKAELGVSAMTAWRWMEMAKAARPRLAKDHTDLAALLAQPPSNLTEAERESLKRAVHKITDGQTQSELMLEWGITKKGGGEAKGGNLGKGAPALTNGEDAGNAPAPAPQIPADVVWWARHLPDLNLELCVRSSWAKLPIRPEDCPRANLTNLRDMLATALEAIDAHLKAHS